MPRLDGTGPSGEGARTGRGLGNCDVNETNNNANNGTMAQRTFGRIRKHLNGSQTRNQGR
jgi:hypothetical protein